MTFKYYFFYNILILENDGYVYELLLYINKYTLNYIGSIMDIVYIKYIII